MNQDSIVLKDFEHLKEKYCEMTTLRRENLNYSISGNVSLIDPDSGKIWETYSLRINIPYSYPKELPSIFEIGNKIPKNRHINSDGTCCLAPTVEQWLILGNKYTLVDFIDKLVIPFLATQKLVECGQGWNNGEYAHSGEGLLEYYKQKLLINKTEVVLNCLYNLNIIATTHANQVCFCRSGSKFKSCHSILIQKLLPIEPDLIIRDIILIESYLKNKIYEKK